MTGFSDPPPGQASGFSDAPSADGPTAPEGVNNVTNGTNNANTIELLPEGHTLYVNNLNDRVKLDMLKHDLMALFSQYGKIIDLVAMSSFWRRGQAWIVFDTVAEAKAALLATQGHFLHGKPIRVNFSADVSDAILRREGKEITRAKGPKKPRQVRRREAEFMASVGAAPPECPTGPPAPMMPHHVGQPFAAPMIPTAPMAPMGYYYPTGYPVGAGAPNRVLFISGVPSGTADHQIAAVFRGLPGFLETRAVLARGVAFAEFDCEENAAAALRYVQGQMINGKRVDICFAKR